VATKSKAKSAAKPAAKPAANPAAKPAAKPSKTPAKPTAKTAVKRRGVKLAPPAPPSRAKQVVKGAPPRAPRLADALKEFETAVKLFQRGNFGPARDSFEKIKARYPNQSEIIARVETYLSICNLRLARPARAPQTPESLYDQGVVELNRAHYNQAIELFKRALKSQPRSSHILYSLAAAQVRSGQTDEGLKTLEEAVEVKELHRTRARTDPDFTALHEDARFQELVGLNYGS
jgi:TolA-binding protein